MNRQLQLFLNSSDETNLSAMFCDEIPAIRYLNGNVWNDEIQTGKSIGDCDSGIAYLCNLPLQDLPTIRRKNGAIEGPAAGLVVQLIRSRQTDSVLLSGRVAAGWRDDDELMHHFVSSVWKCIKSIGTIGVIRPDGRMDKHYLVGEATKRQFLAGELSIADRATKMQYRPY